MKHLLISITTLFLMIGCTFSPLPFEDDATSQTVNTTLVCAKEIDVYQLSINGIKPPKASFEFYIKKLKKYTTDDIVIHDIMNIAVQKDRVDDFVQSYGRGGMHLYDLVDGKKMIKDLLNLEKK